MIVAANFIYNSGVGRQDLWPLLINLPSQDLKPVNVVATVKFFRKIGVDADLEVIACLPFRDALEQATARCHTRQRAAYCRGAIGVGILQYV